MADRFNLTTPRAVQLFARDNDGVGEFASIPAFPVGDSLHQIASGRRDPIYHESSAAAAIAYAKWDAGGLWYSDGSAPKDDIDGNRYSRLWVDYFSAYILIMRSLTQDALTLAAQLDSLKHFVASRVPNGRLGMAGHLRLRLRTRCSGSR